MRYPVIIESIRCNIFPTNGNDFSYWPFIWLTLRFMITDCKKIYILILNWDRIIFCIRFPKERSVRPPITEMMFISFSGAYVSMWSAAIIDYWLNFHFLYFTRKWDCKQVNWDTNSFFLASFEPLEQRKYHARIIILMCENHSLYVRYFS